MTIDNFNCHIDKTKHINTIITIIIVNYVFFMYILQLALFMHGNKYTEVCSSTLQSVHLCKYVQNNIIYKPNNMSITINNSYLVV